MEDLPYPIWRAFTHRSHVQRHQPSRGDAATALLLRFFRPTMARMDEKPRRRRFCFRFSLASLLLFTAAVGAILAVMRLQLFRHANQAAVVAEIMSSYSNGPYDEVQVNTKVAP